MSRKTLIAGRDGARKIIQDRVENAYNARPLATVAFAVAAGAVVISPILAPMSFGGGYAYSQWHNSDEFRIQREKMWASERAERQAVFQEELKAAETTEAIDNAKAEAQTEIDKVKAELDAAIAKAREEADAVLASIEEEKDQAIAEHGYDPVEEHKQGLIDDMFARTSLEDAICLPWKTEFNAEYDEDGSLLSLKKEYVTSLSSGLDTSENQNHVLACKEQFSQEDFLNARGLPQLVSQKHYEQIRDMMSMCGGVSHFKIKVNELSSGKFSTSFETASGAGTMNSHDDYIDYYNCMYGSLENPLIKIASSDVPKPPSVQ